MPRGDNPNSRKNLYARTSEEARKNGTKGGINSGKSRGAISNARKVAKGLIKDADLEEIIMQLVRMAKRGNINATKLLLDILGENLKPDIDIEEQKARIRQIKAQTERIASGMIDGEEDGVTIVNDAEKNSADLGADNPEAPPGI